MIGKRKAAESHEDYLNGMDIEEIARRHRVAQSTLYKAWKYYRMPRTRHCGVNLPARVMAMHRMRTKGMTYNAIGIKYNVSKQRVYQLLHPRRKNSYKRSQANPKGPNLPTPIQGYTQVTLSD